MCWQYFTFVIYFSIQKWYKEKKLMSCFIHRKKDGVAVCKQCGKNMCEDCSSLVSHSGLCPTCYRPHIVKKIINAEQEKRMKHLHYLKKLPYLYYYVGPSYTH